MSRRQARGRQANGSQGSHPAADAAPAAEAGQAGASPDEVWLAATWPFVRGHLPSPPARVAELGCGPLGGHVPALLRAGYDATGIDPEAPEGVAYRRVAFEDYRPDGPVDAVIASVSLHHVDDPGTVLDHVCEVLGPRGTLVVLEWNSEHLDEPAARWCFRHRLLDRADHGGWLAGLRDEWAASALAWDTFFRGWLEQHGIHPAAVIRRELAARFVTVHKSNGPYY